LVRLYDDSFSEAAQVLERAVDLEEPDQPIPLAFRPSVQMLLLRAWTGELDAAREALLLVGKRCVSVGEENELIFVAFHLALIDIWRGDYASAAVTADETIERAPQLGGPQFVRHGQTFDDRGSRMWSDRAKAELARGTSGRQRSEGLTPSERRVAELAVSGVTNRDIAAALFISPKTVEVNLSRIYRKLKVRSRMELYRAWQSGQIGKSYSVARKANQAGRRSSPLRRSDSRRDTAGA
jgi:DNA-binding CsgD family transcriptional regulator